MKARFLLAVGIATLSTPATALAADPTPVAGCSASRELLTIDETLKRVDFRIYKGQEEEIIALVESLDENGDEYLCSKPFKPNRGQDRKLGVDDYAYLQVGDNQITSRL
jgi:hypothetical protein